MARKDYDKTLSRLIGILSLLSLNRRPTIPELAKEYGVTVRTIQKDVYQRLKAFPLYRNDLGQIQFIEGFSLDKSLLESEEMILVSLALSQFQGVHDFDHLSHSVIQKLLYPKLFNPYFIKYNDIEPLDTHSPMIKQLRTAIEDKRMIEMTFADKVVKVEPYRIANFDGFWYLFGKDLQTHKVKTFMIRKIQSFECLADTYTMSHAQIDKLLGYTHSAWFEDGEGFTVQIKVHTEIADYFRQKSFLKSQEIIETLEDGCLIVEFEVTHDEDIDNIIKAWLPHIEVLKPEKFRGRIIDELETYLTRLRADQGTD